MNKLKNKKRINNSGFTIMETLVAIFILLISITGPMVFSQSALRTAFQSRDQITAFYLAQDAIEYIKSVRDHRALSRMSGDWLGEMLDLCGIDALSANPGCTVDTVQGEIRSCSLGSSPIGCEGRSPLNLDNNGRFGFSGSSSLFYRTIYIEEVVPNAEVQIVVKIQWTSHDTIGTREILVAENIFNWPVLLVGDND